MCCPIFFKFGLFLFEAACIGTSSSRLIVYIALVFHCPFAMDGAIKKAYDQEESFPFLFLVETFPISFTEGGGRVNAKAREKALLIFFCYILPFLILSPLVEKRSNDRMGPALVCFFFNLCNYDFFLLRMQNSAPNFSKFSWGPCLQTPLPSYI